MHCFTRGSRMLVGNSRLFTRYGSYSTMQKEDHKLGEFFDYMERLKNYERLGVPKGAGTESEDGFDLERMRHLLGRLDNPHTRFRAVHIAGTKGKGSTAAFLSNVLREEGYLVGCYTSPHILTLRERICVGRAGDPVSAEALMKLFHSVKGIIDQSIEVENGALSHFEVFTALAFALFSQEKVDVAVIEAGLGGARDATNVLRNTELAVSVITSVGEEHLAALGGSLESIAIAKSGIIKHGRPLVIGGPFELHIERVIRDKALSLNSPVISACDPAIRYAVNCIGREDEKPYQVCDIHIKEQESLPLSIDLPNVKLRMLGNHQLQNAVTATCAVLCLRNQGWDISERSIRAGLERTWLLGRSQFLEPKEAEAFGLLGTSIFLDGAHTEASAKGLSDVINLMHPDGMLAFVVAMANDKEHLAFARQLLSGRRPDLVLLTEVSVAGAKSRTTPSLALKEVWSITAVDSGIDIVDLGMISKENNHEGLINTSLGSTESRPVMLAACQNLSVCDSLKVADQLLKSIVTDKPSLIVVTGSLHLVSSVLAAVHQEISSNC